MYDCIPLFVPSNLGETRLNIRIEPGIDRIVPNASELREDCKGHDETYRFEGYSCFVWAKTVGMAQQTAIRMSKQLEKYPRCPIQSDRLYFLPLFAKVCYSLTVTPKAHHECAVIRIAYRKEDQTLSCKIYASNLVQLQEALLSHKRNLLKKRLQVLNQQRTKTWEKEVPSK